MGTLKALGNFGGDLSLEQIAKIAGKRSRVLGYGAAVTKGLVWDFALRGTAVNLFTVIAPLYGVIEGTSLLTRTFVTPSAFTDVEKTFWNSTLGAFWHPSEFYDDPVNGSRVDSKNAIWDQRSGIWRDKADGKQLYLLAGTGNELKYLDILSNKQDVNGKGLLNKLSLIGNRLKIGVDLVDRAYSAGLFGTNPTTGLAKVNSLSDKTVKSLAGFWKALDKQNVAFSAALAILQPLAEPIFSNIKAGNFGRGYQAVGKAMEETFSAKVILNNSPRAAAKA